MWVHIPHYHLSGAHITAAYARLPAIPETFRFSLVYRLFFTFGLLFFVGCFFGCLICPGQEEPPGTWVPILFLGFIALPGGALWFGLQTVTVDSRGIRTRRLGFGTKSLDWDQVREIRESAGWSVLELHGPSGGPVVRVASSIKGFPRLREIIIQATGLAILGDNEAGLQQITLPVNFRLGSSAVALVAYFSNFVLGVMLVYLVYDGEYRMVSAALVALLVAFAVVLMRRWHSLSVEPDKLVLRSLLRTKEIPLADVEAAEIRTVEFAHSSIVMGGQHHLLIKLTDAREINLGIFQETLKASVVIEAVKQQMTTGS